MVRPAVDGVAQLIGSAMDHLVGIYPDIATVLPDMSERDAQAASRIANWAKEAEEDLVCIRDLGSERGSYKSQTWATGPSQRALHLYDWLRSRYRGLREYAVITKEQRDHMDRLSRVEDPVTWTKETLRKETAREVEIREMANREGARIRAQFQRSERPP